MALPVIVATAALGHALSGPWDAARRSNVVKFGLASLASCAAALANPYGFGLYRHVGRLLVSSGVTSLIIEYQPPHFGKPEAEVLEWVLLALVGLPVLSARRIDRYQLCHVLVWLHLALTSIRNAPLFALVAAPALATLIDGLPLSLRNAWKRDDTPGDLAGGGDDRRAGAGDGRAHAGRVRPQEMAVRCARLPQPSAPPQRGCSTSRTGAD